MRGDSVGVARMGQGPDRCFGLPGVKQAVRLRWGELEAKGIANRARLNPSIPL